MVLSQQYCYIDVPFRKGSSVCTKIQRSKIVRARLPARVHCNFKSLGSKEVTDVDWKVGDDACLFESRTGASHA